MPRVSYPQILALQTESNKKLYAAEAPTHYALETTDTDGKVITANLAKQIIDPAVLDEHGHPTGAMKPNPEITAFLRDVLPHCNMPIPRDEVRFESPNYCVNRATWDGRTTGDHAAWYVAIATGSVDSNGQPMFYRDPVDASSFIGVAGLQDLQEFGVFYAAGNMTAAFGHLYAAREHALPATYDDVNYQWIKNADSSRIAYFDAAALEWKRDDGAPIVKYVAAADQWVIQNPVNGNWEIPVSVTGIQTSRYRMRPYPDKILQITQVLMRANHSTNFNGAKLIYEGYGYADSQSQPQPAPFPGIFKGKVWIYNSMSAFQDTINDELPPDPDGIVTYIIDYRTFTQPLTLSGPGKQYVDVFVDNDGLFTGTTRAKASFIAMNLGTIG